MFGLRFFGLFAATFASLATPALAALADAGVPHEVVKFAHDPRKRSFGDEAVRALTTDGAVDPGQIYKTLIIAVPDGLAVAILPAPARPRARRAARGSRRRRLPGSGSRSCPRR